MENKDFFSTLDALIRAQNDSSSGSQSAAEVLASMGTPSTSIATLDHGSISARTFSTLGHNPETVFQACSISKPVAGMAVMKLIEAGKLRLDAPITEYLSPELMGLITTASTRQLVGQITIKQLMSHTAGLSQGGFPGYPRDDCSLSLHDILSGRAPANTLHVHVSGLPGQRFSYSGGGITVLQLIMEEVTGKTLPELVHELVLEPLEMHRSFYRIPEEKDNYASCYWTGYKPIESGFHVLREQGAAGLWTTPTDLLKVIRALQRSLNPSNSTSSSNFLPQALAQQMLTEISSGMALTWFAPSAPGTVFAHAGGNDPGFRCYVLGYADLAFHNKTANPDLAASMGCGMCIMTNSCEGNTLYPKLMLAIAQIKGWAEIPCAEPILPDVVIPFHDIVDLKSSQDPAWSAWAGTWSEDADGDTWRIHAQNGNGEDVVGAPCVSFQGLPAVRLIPAARPRAAGAIDLVLEGLEMMVRLIEEEAEKVVQVGHGPTCDKTTLRRRKK